ncbi:MAG: tetratricopeptide repeat protein, partial [Flavobacteriales bacterium]|nr:tetratricopeptide repeat protein [Flavobacteriales bacterium]
MVTFSQKEIIGQADSLLKAGQSRTALQLLADEARQFSLGKEWDKFSRLKAREIRMYSDLNNDDKAMAVVEAALKLCASAMPQPVSAQIVLLKERAALEFKNGDMTTALATLREAEARLRTQPDTKELIKIRNQAGGMLYQTGDYHGALLHYRLCVSLAPEVYLDDSLRLGRLHYELGSAYWGIGQADSCRISYENALALWEPSQGQWFSFLGEIYNVLGELEWNQGNSSKARQYF